MKIILQRQQTFMTFTDEELIENYNTEGVTQRSTDYSRSSRHFTLNYCKLMFISSMRNGSP